MRAVHFRRKVHILCVRDSRCTGRFDVGSRDHTERSFKRGMPVLPICIVFFL